MGSKKRFFILTSAKLPGFNKEIRIRAMNFFITGVSQGLGAALTRRLLSKGHTVYGISRHPPAEGVARPGESFIWQPCDITQPAAISKIIAHQASTGFVPDIVVLNAGMHQRDPEPFSFSACDKLYQANCRGSLVWVEHYLPAFLARRNGHFVLISSLSSLFAFPFRAAYSASKSYTSAAFACLRRSYSLRNIFFTVVYAGLMDTPMAAQAVVPSFFKYSPEAAARIIERAIRRRRSVAMFPFRGIWLELALRLLPDRWLIERLAARR